MSDRVGQSLWALNLISVKPDGKGRKRKVGKTQSTREIEDKDKERQVEGKAREHRYPTGVSTAFLFSPTAFHIHLNSTFSSISSHPSSIRATTLASNVKLSGAGEAEVVVLIADGEDADEEISSGAPELLL